MNPTVYAMCGTIGAGKTAFAKKLALEKSALVFCIDDDVKRLGQPIRSAEDYDKYYFGVRAIITGHALNALKLGVPVVFDFGGGRGHWDWLKAIADVTQSPIEIYHLLAPLEVRRERVRKRNLEADCVFKFSDAEFDSMPKESATPDPRPGLKLWEIKTES